MKVIDIHSLAHYCNLLRIHIEDPELDSKSKGLISNLLGELNKILSVEKNDVANLPISTREFIEFCKSNKLISDYLAAYSEFEKVKADTYRDARKEYKEKNRLDRIAKHKPIIARIERPARNKVSAKVEPTVKFQSTQDGNNFRKEYKAKNHAEGEAKR